MSLPNSMTVGRSYSDYIRGDFDWSKDETKDPCEKCDGAEMSDCCGAMVDPDLLLCHECHEHCQTQCDECEDKKEYDERNK
jgi:hypothetical protein